MGRPILAHSCAALWDHSNKTHGTHPRCWRALLQPGSKMCSNQIFKQCFVDSPQKKFCALRPGSPPPAERCMAARPRPRCVRPARTAPRGLATRACSADGWLASTTRRPPCLSPWRNTPAAPASGPAPCTPLVSALMRSDCATRPRHAFRSHAVAYHLGPAASPAALCVLHLRTPCVRPPAYILTGHMATHMPRAGDDGSGSEQRRRRGN